MKIKKVIIPAAGLGTRFLPATKAMPKEMLPIVDKPTIQFIVEEAIASGIEDIIIVTGKGKRAIEDHFDNAFELEANLLEKEKFELLASCAKSIALERLVLSKIPPSMQRESAEIILYYTVAAAPFLYLITPMTSIRHFTIGAYPGIDLHELIESITQSYLTDFAQIDYVQQLAEPDAHFQSEWRKCKENLLSRQEELEQKANVLNNEDYLRAFRQLGHDYNLEKQNVTIEWAISKYTNEADEVLEEWLSDPLVSGDKLEGARRIREVLNRKSDTISLSSLNLNHLPDKLAKIPFLRKIYVNQVQKNHLSKVWQPYLTVIERTKKRKINPI